jgi:hypothetical protein
MTGLDRPAPVARFTKADMLAVAALLGGFIGVVLWFDRVDFYHKHFFDAGAIVFADNMVRIVFVGIFSWLIYAPGAAVVARVTTPAERAATCITAPCWLDCASWFSLHPAGISPMSPSLVAMHSPAASPRCGNAVHRRRKSARS